MSVVYEIVGKQPHETPREAIIRVHGVGFFDTTVDSWEAPTDKGPWQTAWLHTVVEDLLAVHAWSREDDEHGTTLWAQDHAWQIEVYAGSADLRYRNQWIGEPGSPLDATVLQVFARAGAVLLTPDLDDWFDLGAPDAPRELN